MAKAADRKEIFERMPVPKALAVMAVPTVISQLVNLLYNIVDSIYIGRTGNSYMVAGVSLSFTLFVMTVSFSNFFGVGGGSLIARLSGSGRENEAKSVSAFSVTGALISAACYSLLVGLFMDPILKLFGASEYTLPFARQYVMLVVVLGNIPVILSGTLAHLLRNTGNAKTASLGLSGGGVLNMLLDPLFMFVLLPEGYEVFGAALATLLSNLAAMIFLLIKTAETAKDAPLSLDLRKAGSISRENRHSLAVVGGASAILIGLVDIANIFLNARMASHGDDALAAIGIVMKAEKLPNSINIGICQGMLPIVAYNYASGNRARMQETIKTTRIVGLSISAISMLLYEVFTKPVMQVFLSTKGGTSAMAAATLAVGVSFLRLRCLASPLQFLNYSSSFTLQAVGDGRDTLIHACMRELVFYIPFMYLLDALFGKVGLAAALIAGEGGGALTALWFLRRRFRTEQGRQ